MKFVASKGELDRLLHHMKEEIAFKRDLLKSLTKDETLHNMFRVYLFVL